MRTGDVPITSQGQDKVPADAASVDNPCSSVIQLQVYLRCGDAELPLDIQVQMNPQLLKIIGHIAASQQKKTLGGKVEIPDQQHADQARHREGGPAAG